MDFKDFCKTEESKKANSVNSNNMNKNNNLNDATTNINKEDINKKIDKYSKFSKDELMTEFLKESRKKEGGYSSEEINKIKDVLFPLLNADQQKYFYELMNMVK